ncbi:MAG TPA: CHAT domain-containing protein, partial [Lamprocystis sp. (in: g-proteobacteria)]|nr:CHAT domain-containing protein [Lamprocystis sp. (in: g-proteobacteria)]
CCHLGKTQRTTPARYNELAANLAVQFIRMGVKAVIAAGWAVDDRAGLAFAEHFYVGMLTGQPFGEAVRAAREQVWQRFADVNTWGAYQCYGDPAYALRIAPTPAAGQVRRPYHAPCELVADLTNLREQIRMQMRERGEDPQTLTDLRTRIEDLITAIPEAERTDWLARADLAAAIGLTWGETRAWKEAATWLDQALAAEIGDCPVRVVEYGNEFRVRVIGDEWRTLRAAPEGYRKEDGRQALVGRVEQCIAELIIVCQRAATAQRLTVIGLACRQLAWLQTEPRGRLEALVNMANFLERALAKSEQADAQYFPLWAAAKLLALGLDADRGGDWQARLPDDLRRMSAEAARLNEQDPSFRNGVAVAYNDTALLLTQPDPAPGDVAAVIDRYQEVFRRGASPREVASVHESLDFLIDLGDGLPAPVVRALGEIRAAL